LIDLLTERDYSEILQCAFLKCDEELNEQSKADDKQDDTPEEQDAEPSSKPFDVKFSGSTVCVVLFDGSRIHCANLGDSRAIKV